MGMGMGMGMGMVLAMPNLSAATAYSVAKEIPLNFTSGRPNN